MRKTLAEALEDEISKRRMTQREAAAEIGTDPANLSRWLKGGDISARFVRGLTDFLHVDQDQLGGSILEERIRKHAREIADR